MTISVNGREMQDATCNFISLVPKGANQIPFRILKSAKPENPMLDLSNPKSLKTLFKSAKSNEPKISAVLVGDSLNTDEVRGILKSNGLSVEGGLPVKETDGVTVYVQDGFNADTAMADTHMFQLSDDLTVAVKGFSPWSDSLAGFADRIGAQGFYMSLDAATDVLGCTLFDAAYDSATQKDMAAKIETAIDEFKSYTLGLVKGLPQAAFKAQKGLKELAEKAAKVPTHQKQGPRDTNMTAGNGATDKNGEQSVDSHVHGQGGSGATSVDQHAPKKPGSAKKEDGTLDEAAIKELLSTPEGVEALKAQLMDTPVIGGENAGTGNQPGAQAEGSADTGAVALPSAVNKSESAEVPTNSVDESAVTKSNESNEVAQTLKGITDAINGLTARFDQIETTQKAMQAQVEEVVGAADTATKALRSAVGGGASISIEQPTNTTARKSQPAPEDVPIDTALFGRNNF